MSHTSVSPEPKHFIGLDIHKRFFVATGVNDKQETVFGPHKVDNALLEKWAEKELTPFDAVVIEMTTNAYTVHDLLVDRVHSVTVVHPPLVAMIASSRVKTDKRDALILAQLLAAGLLSTVWIPPQEVRDLRALIAQRWKMLRLRSLAKNRLHSVLHRHQIVPFPGIKLFAKESVPWWLALPVSTVERGNLQCDLNTLFFADEQLKAIEETLKASQLRRSACTCSCRSPAWAW